MKLSAWMVLHGLTDVELAKQIGVAAGTVRGWRTGRCTPCRVWLTRLTSITRSRVCERDFVRPCSDRGYARRRARHVHIHTPSSVSDLIDAFGGPTEFAKVLRRNPSTASEMKRAGSIRVSYWPSIIEAAAARGLEGITADLLVRLHAPQSAEATS